MSRSVFTCVHGRRMDEPCATCADDLTVAIDPDDLEEARRDPKVRQTLKNARKPTCVECGRELWPYEGPQCDDCWWAAG